MLKTGELYIGLCKMWGKRGAVLWRSFCPSLRKRGDDYWSRLGSGIKEDSICSRSRTNVVNNGNSNRQGGLGEPPERVISFRRIFFVFPSPTNSNRMSIGNNKPGKLVCRVMILIMLTINKQERLFYWFYCNWFHHIGRYDINWYHILQIASHAC